MHDIICIGSAVRDIFVLSHEFEIIKTAKVEGGLAECVPLGSKIDIEDLFVTTGGGGTNTAATFANLGLKTSIIARLGEDEDGDMIEDELITRKIDTKILVRDKKDATGLSILLTAPGGERTVLVYRGVSGNFTEKDIPITKLRTRAIYLSSIGGHTKTLSKIATFAKKKGVFLAWNPGKTELKLPKKTIRTILTKVDVLIVNKEEALMLYGKKPEHLSLHGLAKHIRGHEDQIVIITDGPRGTCAIQRDNAWLVGTSDVKSKSRTGAGDAFGSGTVAALLQGIQLQDALRVGTLNAESVIQSYGAKQGILTKLPSPSKLDTIPYKKL